MQRTDRHGLRDDVQPVSSLLKSEQQVGGVVNENRRADNEDGEPGSDREQDQHRRCECICHQPHAGVVSERMLSAMSVASTARRFRCANSATGVATASASAYSPSVSGGQLGDGRQDCPLARAVRDIPGNGPREIHAAGIIVVRSLVSIVRRFTQATCNKPIKRGGCSANVCSLASGQDATQEPQATLTNDKNSAAPELRRVGSPHIFNVPPAKETVNLTVACTS